MQVKESVVSFNCKAKHWPRRRAKPRLQIAGGDDVKEDCVRVLFYGTE